MRANTCVVLLVASAAVVSGCKQPEPPPPAEPRAASTTAAAELVATVTTVAAEAAPAPAPVPVTSILKGATAIEAAQRIPLAAGAEVVVDPRATFEVELSARSADARLVLVDGREDILPATGGREVAGGTRLTLAPAAPLVPGSRYALRLDGAAQRELHDEAGRAFSPVTFPVLAAGTPPPPEPKRPTRKKKRR